MKARESKITAQKKEARGLIIRAAITTLALFGTGISGYLTFIHYQNLSSICLFGLNCDTVLTSRYAAMWGIPLSLFGILMYVAIAGLGLISLRAKNKLEVSASLGIYTIALSGIFFTGYLYYLEIFVIHAFCMWCITSSIVLLIIFILSLVNLSISGMSFTEIPRSLKNTVSRYVGW